MEKKLALIYSFDTGQTLVLALQMAKEAWLIDKATVGADQALFVWNGKRIRLTAQTEVSECL